MFKFRGSLLISKSWLNRAQIIYSYQKEKKINANFESQDVLDLEKCIQDFQNGKTEFDIGQGGTTLRFFIFLITRKPGRYILRIHDRLMDRPHEGAFSILDQMGVQVVKHKDYLEVLSSGWNWNSEVNAFGQSSSQFVSGLLLSSWHLEKELDVIITKPIQSSAYLLMTIQLLQKSGLCFEINENESYLRILIAPNQSPNVENLNIELDVSSAFSLAACAVVDGDVEITNWSINSIQPDSIFLDLFKKMGIRFEESNDRLKIIKHNNWNSIDANLNSSPDLFPVLAALLALAQGKSRLYGASQLKDKESDRIHKTFELLSSCGFKVEKNEDGLTIYGGSSLRNKSELIEFDPDHDHRMAMAAAIFKLAGFNIHIRHANVVNKSYPQFWSNVGVIP